MATGIPPLTSPPRAVSSWRRRIGSESEYPRSAATSAT